MSTYKDTVQNFFDESSNYKPLNDNVFASVFLIKADDQKEYLHFLQLESVEIQDDEKKDDDNDQQGVKDMDTKEDLINIELISKYIIGLKTYEANMDENKVK